jgi:hypothetical protein
VEEKFRGLVSLVTVKTSQAVTKHEAVIFYRILANESLIESVISINGAPIQGLDGEPLLSNSTPRLGILLPEIILATEPSSFPFKSANRHMSLDWLEYILQA